MQHGLTYSPMPRWRKIIAAVCLLAGGLFLFRGLPSLSEPDVPPSSPGLATSASGEARYVTTDIEKVRVGDWLLARNPELGDAEHEACADIDPASWRQVRLRMEKPDGRRVDIVLLRPTGWLEDVGAQVGATLYLEVAELGAEGPAEILSIEPCPEIGPAPSPDCRVVTGTFAHSAGEIVDVSIEGLDEPIGCTANHPFWSENRQEFVEAGELVEGETLLTGDDTPAYVIAVTPRHTTESVYNLEVDVEHVYYVSTSGVLVHNTCQRHHAVPWNNKNFNHQKHPLLKQAAVRLKRYKINIRSVVNHSGRHSPSYHQKIQLRLDRVSRGTRPMQVDRHHLRNVGLVPRPTLQPRRKGE